MVLSEHTEVLGASASESCAHGADFPSIHYDLLLLLHKFS